jgi:SAM-dependent methyltransferase
MTDHLATSTVADFPYDRAETELVPCNLCGGRDVETVGQRDRNGLAVRSVICTHCGLIYLSPRMTPAWYARYYEVEYRRQMRAFHGKDSGSQQPEVLFRQQLRRGRHLARYLRAVGCTGPRRILEVGSSTGGLLKALGEEFGAAVMGAEPSPEEAAFAAGQGVPTRVGLFEDLDFPPTERYDLILSTQSFNHLLDPRRVAGRIADLLAPGGLFLLECQNFFHLWQFWGCRERAVQIDHTYMFVPLTLQALLEASGLEVIPAATEVDADLPARVLRTRRRLGIPSLHIRLLSRRASAPAGPVSALYPLVKAEMRGLPESPLLGRLSRGWERQLMRWDNVLSRLWPGGEAEADGPARRVA